MKSYLVTMYAIEAKIITFKITFILIFKSNPSIGETG